MHTKYLQIKAVNMLLTSLLVLSLCQACKSPAPSRAVIVVHGGAGVLDRAKMGPELEKEYREALAAALRAGHAVLSEGGSALDAVSATILPLEDSHLFNAGHGAVFSAEGRCELDASIMDGAGPRAGAVAGVQGVRHPILAARAVMEKSEHVLLSGAGADAFAKEQGLETVSNEFFHTERRRRALEQQLADDKHGTVGCVALDSAGHLAAGTSTGGMTAKRWGRVGDSPIIGAGTWAQDGVCAVSATGWGEYFIRGAIASNIAGRMRFGGLSLDAAGSQAIHKELTERGGTGGVIALDSEGRFTTPFNTPGMFRGWVTLEGQVTVKIWKGE